MGWIAWWLIRASRFGAIRIAANAGIGQYQPRSKTQWQPHKNKISTLALADLSTAMQPANVAEFFRFETSKYYNGGLISDAGVYWVGAHSRQSCISLGTDSGDYGKRLKISDKAVKATQKNIDRQHAEVFTDAVVESLVKAAKARYARVIEVGVDGFGNTYPNAAKS